MTSFTTSAPCFDPAQGLGEVLRRLEKKVDAVAVLLDQARGRCVCVRVRVRVGGSQGGELVGGRLLHEGAAQELLCKSPYQLRAGGHVLLACSAPSSIVACSLAGCDGLWSLHTPPPSAAPPACRMPWSCWRRAWLVGWSSWRAGWRQWRRRQPGGRRRSRRQRVSARCERV